MLHKNVFILIVSLFYISAAKEAVTTKFSILDSPVEQVVWCGSSVVVSGEDEFTKQGRNEAATHKKVLFLLSENGIIYRSIDYGLNFVNITYEIITNYSRNEDLQIDRQYKTKEILQSPANSNTIYLMGENGNSFRSFNCGKNFTAFKHPANLTNFKLNQMDAKIMMAFMEKNCKAAEGRMCRERFKKDLCVSEDAGQNWRTILTHVREATWDKLIPDLAIPDNRIVAVHVAENTSLVISQSDDYFKSREVIRWHTFGYYQTQHYLFLLVQGESIDDGFEMEIVYLQQEIERRRIQLELSESIEQHSFTVVNSQDGLIYISVQHNENIPQLTNLYMSDSQGNQFQISLSNIVRSADAKNCDFEHISGVEGVYIANVFENEESQKFLQKIKFSNDENEIKKKLEKLESFKRSVRKKIFTYQIKKQISFDKGSIWHPIKAPKYNVEGWPMNCNGDCSLHLRGRAEALSNPIYSSSNAHGIILATGNTGTFLTQNISEVNTYLSRDGGHNWFEVLKGPHIYEIGDHGGIIVFAATGSTTTKILYTWDEGNSFETVQISDSIRVKIENILTEPSNMEQKFIVIGSQDSRALGEDEENEKKNNRGIVVAIDFTSLHQRDCSGQLNPGTPESDYEYWQPMNYIGEKCLFGKSVQYLRRKRKSKCFNPEVIEKPTIISNCPCTEEDWECDFGYQRDQYSNACKLVDDNSAQAPEDCQDTYMKSQGYRKIPGDECIGGTNLGYIETPCPKRQSSQKQEIKEEGKQQIKKDFKEVPTQVPPAKSPPETNYNMAPQPQQKKWAENKVKEKQSQSQESKQEDSKQSINPKTKYNKVKEEKITEQELVQTKKPQNIKKERDRIKIEDYEQGHDYKKIFLLLLFAVAIYLFKNKVLSFFRGDDTQPQKSNRNYYPATEEEMEARAKKIKTSNRKTKQLLQDDGLDGEQIDDEAGL